MKKICSACNFLGKETRTMYLYVVGPLFLMLLSLSFLINQEVFANAFMATFAALIWLAFGIYGLIFFLNNPNQCPNCKKKRAMIPLDTPRAQELIKEHNLTVPTK